MSLEEKVFKIRGTLVSERMAFCLEKWKKVIDDGSSDTSQYRIDFSAMHLRVYNILIGLFEKNNSVSASHGYEESFVYMANHFLNNHKVWMNPNSLGHHDAIKLIILEIKDVLNV